MRILTLALALAPLAAQAKLDPEAAGRIIAQHDGRHIELPMIESDLSVSIEGDMAAIEITQTFENNTQIPLNAEYLFPLNQRAAVYGMTMEVGDEVITAVIREKAQAQAEFNEAKREGKATALLTQHRPNMFTQEVANLMPGQPITTRLRYVQMVPKVEGRFELVIPMVVGPRYQSPEDTGPALTASLDETSGQWTVSDLPAYPEVAGLTVPDTVAPERVSLDLTLTSGVTLTDFGSETHPLAIVEDDSTLKAAFAQGQVLDNRDLVVHYSLGGQSLDAAALFHNDPERGGYLSLMVEPPQITDDTPVAPRELVFVLDTSGSMGGIPMAVSRRFMSSALAGLRPEDHFRIIPFSNTASQMSAEALPATPANIDAAQAYVTRLSTGGGTEIDRAIRTAFSTPKPADALRIVVFLSDGYIGNEARVLQTIRQQIGEARIYAFGVGNGVNRYLLDSMAEEGRGYARYVMADEDAMEVAEDLAANLKTPVLTDIEVDWGDMAVEDVVPARLPDLFNGSSLRVYARHNVTEPTTITLKGLVNGRRAELPVRLVPADSPEPALPLIWARARIGQMERNVAVNQDAVASDAEITRLGLEYSLQTKNTSFVAVSQKVVNNTGLAAQDAAVPLPVVSNVEATAYPQAFAGSSSPEPQGIIGLLIVAGLGASALRRRLAQ